MSRRRRRALPAAAAGRRGSRGWHCRPLPPTLRVGVQSVGDFMARTSRTSFNLGGAVRLRRIAGDCLFVVHSRHPRIDIAQVLVRDGVVGRCQQRGGHEFVARTFVVAFLGVEDGKVVAHFGQLGKIGDQGGVDDDRVVRLPGVRERNAFEEPRLGFAGPIEPSVCRG